ncbi:MAG: class I SAM-dependent methyltransferase [Bacteroidota bacterium]
MESNSNITYHFKYVEHCNMCGSPASGHKILGKRLNRSQGLNPRNKIGITTTIQKCKKCSLIYGNPMPVVDSLQDHYGVVPNDYWKPEYFDLDENYFKAQIDIYKQLKGDLNGHIALDIGAGIGKAMIALGKAGFNAYGIEPSEPFYEKAIEQMKISGDHLQNFAIEDYKGMDNYYDFVTFGAVLEHLYYPSESIQRVLGWLKPGGLIQIEVPSSAWFTNSIYNFLYKVQGLDYVGNISPMHTPYHLYEFALKSFELNGKKNGYQVVKHRYMVCSTYLPKVIDPIVKPYMKLTNRGMQLEVWLQKL